MCIGLSCQKNFALNVWKLQFIKGKKPLLMKVFYTKRQNDWQITGVWCDLMRCGSSMWTKKNTFLKHARIHDARENLFFLPKSSTFTNDMELNLHCIIKLFIQPDLLNLYFEFSIFLSFISYCWIPTTNKHYSGIFFF